jgi:RNA-directed DNA polymerase
VDRSPVNADPKRSAAGVDGQTVEAAKESFEEWIEPMLQSIHRQGYRAPDIRRVYIPKPGKTEKRPLGVPTVSEPGAPAQHG